MCLSGNKGVSVIKEKEIGYECEACGAIMEKDEAYDSPLYQCPACGNIFSEAETPVGFQDRCTKEGCGERSELISDVCCPYCYSGPLKEIDLSEEDT